MPATKALAVMTCSLARDPLGELPVADGITCQCSVLRIIAQGFESRLVNASVGRDGAVVVGDKRDEIHGVLSVENIKCFQQK